MAALAVPDSYAAGFATFTRQKKSNRRRSHHLVSGVEESLPHVVIEREWTNLSTPLGMTHLELAIHSTDYQNPARKFH
jgi:hypothetical protein